MLCVGSVFVLSVLVCPLLVVVPEALSRPLTALPCRTCPCFRSKASSTESPTYTYGTSLSIMSSHMCISLSADCLLWAAVDCAVHNGFLMFVVGVVGVALDH